MLLIAEQLFAAYIDKKTSAMRVTPIEEFFPFHKGKLKTKLH
jgi:hypothetical protein